VGAARGRREAVAVVERLARLVASAELDLRLGEELERLGELRAQRERALEALRSLVVLPRLGKKLAQAVVPQLVVGVVLGHLAELRDPVLQLTHDPISE